MTYFGSHDITNTFKVEPGQGSITVDVPFIPDYIRVRFHGGILSPKPDHPETVGEDSVYWDLANVPGGCQLSIGWSVYTERLVHFRVSRLTVEPV